MPTERFYRLTEEKKMAIRNAAVKEFTRVPFEKASINRMIQDAEISRGSFYTYFEDKRDVLSFIFQDMKEKAKRCCADSLKSTTGNFWLMMEDLMDFTVACCENDDILRLSKNTILFQDDSGMLSSSSHDKGCSREDVEISRWLFEHTDRSDMQILDKTEFQILVDMAMTNLMVSATQYYEKPDNLDKLKETFHRKMEILRYGVSKGNIA